ncbi:DNA replication protein DnaC [Clostridium carboxidivorans P7]|uniref:DNA replication protein DnaC n=1 Tax=Clostridium carboxidivorans P7 TaxID=536227 RepID=C6Q2Q1_9CLOT|nr:DNA replication protein DnaC [Clostridium carboxidivorans P7]EFG87977.1 DNA replication protein DnaC domain protein [Clostridium carboxidivorans P7]
MVKGYQSNIIKVYENIRKFEEKSLNKRREEIQNKFPQIIDIEREIGKLCVRLSITILNNSENKENELKKLKRKNY